jgi:GH35 family endo-1,4-beta-xylanase
MRRIILLSCGAASLALVAPLRAQSISGAAAALRTGGSTSGTAYTLTENGYVGTYLTLAAPATVNFSVSARGAAVGGTAPRMNLVVNDAKFGWDVGESTSNYATSLALPAGTHFVRTELANAPLGSGRTLSVNSLGATGAGVAIANNDSRANALGAANTYINQYRKGSATVALRGPGDIPLLPGTSVNVDLTRHAFNFGTAVAGNNAQPLLTTNATYRQKVNEHFNAVVPENAGKWGSNSSGSTPPPPGSSGNISYSNAILNWAQQNDKRARMHNLIWGSQQPTWVNNMLANAGSHTALRGHVSDRIKYYVGDASDGNPNDDPAARFVELDVYNEGVHTPQYWNAYGAAGVADIYREVRDAADSVGADVRLYANEYNVLQWSSGGDTYANWYRRHVEAINNAGQGEVVTGVGVQYYADTSANAAGAGQAHSVSLMQRALQNLSVTGLPITLTEFGVKSGGTGGSAQSTNQTVHADVLEDTVRMLFGTPQANGFFMWGFYQGNGYIWSEATNGAFYDAAWNLRQTGARWNALMGEWDTNVDAVVNPDGTVTFSGFFGDYSVGGEVGALTLNKGQRDYTVTLAAPPDWQFWAGAVSGEWNAAGNWTNGAPGGVGDTAHFGATANSPVVTVGAPVTVGMINFDNANGYTIVGPGAITMSGPLGLAAMNVVGGSHTITTPVVLDSDLVVTVRPPTSTLTLSGNLVASGRNITKAGAGAVQLENLRAAALDVTGGTVRISPKLVSADPSGTSVLESLTLSPNARLDLTNNALVVDHAPGASPLTTIRTHLISARNGGAWDGAGITSALADASRFAVGYGESGAVFTSFPAAFAGQLVDDSSVLVRFTRYGDANLDGAVNLQDFNKLAANFGAAAARLWTDGDFSYDGTVSLQDFNLLAGNFGLSATGPDVTPENWAALASAVPEPAALPLGSLVTMFLTRRHRRYV